MHGDPITYIREAEEAFQTKTLPILQKHGKTIGKMAQEGDKEASEIIELYSMLHQRFEQGAYGLLAQALGDFFKKRNFEV